MTNKVEKAVAVAIMVGLVALGFVLTARYGGAKVEQSKCAIEAVVTNLTGSWIETGKDSSPKMLAEITNDTIEVYWSADETRALYWAGTYTAPTGAGVYTWNSTNDHTKTDTALLASGNDTKTFVYNNGEITFELTAFGVTTTVHLVRR